MPEPAFTPGEMLEWRNRVTPDGQMTRRAVSFRGMQMHLCVVAFGYEVIGTGQENLYSVPREELVRPQPAQTLKVEPSPLPAPTIPIEERRQTLAQHQASYREALESVNAAQELVTRGQHRVDHTRAVLREFGDIERLRADAVVRELRLSHVNSGNSHSADDDFEEWASYERAQRDCRSAEMAHDQLARELSDAKAIAQERERTIQRAASFVIAGVVERETQRLSELEAQAIQLRVVLRAASMLWVADAPVPVGRKANEILTSWPYDHEDPVGLRVRLAEQRQQPFVQLYSDLCDGNISADLEWHS